MLVRHDQRPVHVALYSGIVMERDAVSNSFLWKLRVLQRLRDRGVPVDVTGFTQGSDYQDCDIRVTPHIGALMRDQAFNSADVHVFEYGMWYELFNALFLIERPALVVDHNTTPPELVNDPIVELACDKAIRERHNLHLASRIATDSEYTRDLLVDMGFGSESITVLHLPPNNTDIVHRNHTLSDPSSGNAIELLFVGRLVKAKGVLDLLEAMTLLWEQDPDLHLTLAGSIQFSQADVLAQVDLALTQHGPAGRLSLIGDATDEAIGRLYGTSDIFVMPSHHEGYCVPVVEALRSDCFVIGSDAGNIPTVMGGLGSVYPTGDVPQLAGRIGDLARRVRHARSTGDALVLPTTRGEMTKPEWNDAVQRHLHDYSLHNFETKFLQIIEDLSPGAPERRPGWLTGALQEPDTSQRSA